MLIAVHLPTLVFNLASLSVQELSRPLIQFAGQFKLALVKPWKRWLVQFGGSKCLIEHKHKEHQNQGKLEEAAAAASGLSHRKVDDLYVKN